MYESKKLMWEVDVEGDEKDNVEEIVKNAINRYKGWSISGVRIFRPIFRKFRTKSTFFRQ